MRVLPFAGVPICSLMGPSDAFFAGSWGHPKRRRRGHPRGGVTQFFYAYRARIEAWLAQPRPLKLTKIHLLLERDHGVSASYDTLRRFAMEELAWRKKTPTVRVADTEPGEVAQIDFGLMGRLLDPATQRARNLWALVVTLAYSRYQFVWPSFEQTTAAVCAGLDAAWWFYGAMARVILPDKMKAIVLRADELAPVLVPAFLDYTQTRGRFVDPARVRSA
ncbi:DDE-type integrase/transposase/recombinase [Sorangium sp. So ce128]|uniref:DDE-type integrase/transposase/recombinase n=1 Tax=Sorangium sp. So ce128 TaxID=3133281 RepID=UPI003F606C03